MPACLTGTWRPLFNPSHPVRTGSSEGPWGDGGNLERELPWDTWDRRAVLKENKRLVEEGGLTLLPSLLLLLPP